VSPLRRLAGNPLWVQLSLAFAGVVILAAVVIGMLGYLLRPELPIDFSQLSAAHQADLRAAWQQARTQGLLLTLSVGGVIGIIAGMWMSMRLAAPLDRLAKGVQAIRARNLAYRVPVQGSQEIRSLARQFNEMAAALESAEQLRQNLLADVAHELRSPLTVLQGNLRAILDDVYTLDKSEVARLYDQTRHLIGLVNDLHELAQAEARQLPLYRQRINVNELVQSAAEILEPIAEQEGVALAVQLPPAPLCLEADKARLMQVLQNLLGNALRHTPSGGAIHVTLERVAPPGAAQAARLTVQDSGDGIDATHLPHVFDRFYRTDRARTRDSGGAGLGLAIVRAMVEAHGGHVSVTSPGLGLGSTFTVCLPVGE
jgi:signal transduction histidine kinase